MSTSRLDDKKIEQVYAGIEKLIKLTNSPDNVIVMDDFNAIVEEEREGRKVGKFGLGKRNERGERLIKFI